MRGAKDVDRINFNRIDNPYRPGDRLVRDEFAVNFIAALGKKLLGIVEPAMPKFLGQDYGRGDHWAGQRAAPRFVDAGDCRDAEGAQSAFMPEATTTVHLAIQTI